MKIGVFKPARLPFSACNYIENVTQELEQSGVEMVYFTETELVPKDIDLYWDPRAMGGAAPYKKLLMSEKPVVVMVHGAAPFALPAREYYPSLKACAIGNLYKLRNLYRWRRFRHRCTAIITVSSYAKWEIQRYLGLDGDKIFPIYHGVDLKIFKPNEVAHIQKPYFLHVSQYQPIKNIDRIIEAYARLPIESKPSLVMQVLGYPRNKSTPQGVELITAPKVHKELAPLYQGATGFVFPSLRETFGMPILEAMACGCPVITSNVTACPEVAGEAALLVNPRSVDEIASAMLRLWEDANLQNKLRQKSLEHAQRFTWAKSAQQHLEVFEKVLKEQLWAI